MVVFLDLEYRVVFVGPNFWEQDSISSMSKNFTYRAFQNVICQELLKKLYLQYYQHLAKRYVCIIHNTVKYL